jgi:hypothetical protein
MLIRNKRAPANNHEEQLIKSIFGEAPVSMYRNDICMAAMIPMCTKADTRPLCTKGKCINFPCVAIYTQKEHINERTPYGKSSWMFNYPKKLGEAEPIAQACMEVKLIKYGQAVAAAVNKDKEMADATTAGAGPSGTPSTPAAA